MGKVRTSIVKRTARKLLALYPDAFSTDFEHNKRKTSELLDVQSKRIRNQVAGYITRLMRIELRKQQASEQA